MGFMPAAQTTIVRTVSVPKRQLLAQEYRKTSTCQVMAYEVHWPPGKVRGTLNMAGDVRNGAGLSQAAEAIRLSSSSCRSKLSSTVCSCSYATYLSLSMIPESVLSSDANQPRVSFKQIQRRVLFGLAAADYRKEKEGVSWKSERDGWVRSRSHSSAASWRCSAASAAAKSETDDSSVKVIPDGSVSVILLAGGKGKRMGANMPKQYLPLLGQPIALYSFHTFSSMAAVGEIIVVCDPSYRDIFEEANISTPVKFALPGKERQDSVWSGLQEISETSKLACIHDSARPLVGPSDILKVINDAWTHGAAVLAVPCKATIKEAGSDRFVKRTLDRKMLWEMQTPQVIEPVLLRKGFELVGREGLEVTDDVSIVEYLKHPVLITEGCYTNLKVTTPDDLLVAERILDQRKT